MKYKIIGVIALIIGVYLCIFSVGFYKTEKNKQDTYIETTATVVGYKDCELSDGDTGSRYIAEYKVDRSTYQIDGMGCTNMPGRIGKKVKIKYNPEDPSEAVFTNDISRFIIPLGGIAFTISSIILFRKKD